MPSLIPSLPLRWLYVDLNAYFASVEQQERPELRGKPVGVVPTMVNSTCCLAASYEAKARGVKTGTNVAEARLKCPGIIFVEGRHDLYVKYHHAIVEAVESCMPVTSVLSIDEMAGRLCGSEQEPAKAIKLAEHIKATIARRVGAYLKSSIGIAPNTYLAKVAGEMKKPDGLTVLESRELPTVLHKLHLRDLPGIGKNMERRLRDSGITTVQKLCALDDKAMRALWGGIGGERFAAGLRGEEVELPPSKHTSLGHSHVLEPAVRTSAGAFRTAQYLLAKAALRLRKMGYWAGGMSLAVRMQRGGDWGQYVKLEDTQATPAFEAHLRVMWEKFPNERPIWVGVTLAPLIPPAHHNLSLFANPKQEKLSHTMDAINEKLGKNTVTYASLAKNTAKIAPTRISFTHVPDASEF